MGITPHMSRVLVHFSYLVRLTWRRTNSVQGYIYSRRQGMSY